MPAPTRYALKFRSSTSTSPPPAHALQIWKAPLLSRATKSSSKNAPTTVSGLDSRVLVLLAEMQQQIAGADAAALAARAEHEEVVTSMQREMETPRHQLQSLEAQLESSRDNADATRACLPQPSKASPRLRPCAASCRSASLS